MCLSYDDYLNIALSSLSPALCLSLFLPQNTCSVLTMRSESPLLESRNRETCKARSLSQETQTLWGSPLEPDVLDTKAVPDWVAPWGTINTKVGTATDYVEAWRRRQRRMCLRSSGVKKGDACGKPEKMDESKPGAEARRGWSHSQRKGEEERRSWWQGAWCVCARVCMCLFVQNYGVSIRMPPLHSSFISRV